MEYGFNDDKSKAKLASVATSGSYTELINKPTWGEIYYEQARIGTVNIPANGEATALIDWQEIPGYTFVAAKDVAVTGTSNTWIAEHTTTETSSGKKYKVKVMSRNAQQQTAYVSVVLLWIKNNL